MSTTMSASLLPENVLEDPSTVDLTANQERVCTQFAEFLHEYRTRAGEILLEHEQGPWTGPDMRALEEEIRNHGDDEHTMLNFFRVLRKLAVCWMMRHQASAPMPKIAVPIPIVDNPSRMDVAKAFRNYRAWTTLLTHQLDAARPSRKYAPLPAFESIVPFLASAIMYGGVWCKPALVSLVRAIPKLLSCTMATDEAIYIGLKLRWREMPFGEFRCWQPDPLSAILLLRTCDSVVREILAPDPSSKYGVLSDTVIFKRIKAEFQCVRNRSSEFSLCNLSLLLKSTQCIGFSCMPAVIARYATRQVISSSLSLEQMQRISGKEWLFGLPLQLAGDQVPTGEEVMPEELRSVPPWARLIESAILKRDIKLAGEEIEELMKRTDLSPLAIRLLDFARKSIVIPAIVRSERSFEAFARRTLILATLMHRQWEGTDPAGLSDKDLEAGYKRMVNVVRESDPAGDTVRDLMYALKNFHSYMRNCCRKGRLKDKKLMVPKSLLDRVDVDLLTISEYRRLREEINLKWPGKKYEARRETGNALTVFGFRWGTRREESRLSRIADLRVDVSVEFLVRASEGHTLKSPNAERRLPGLCLDPNENEVLKNWHSKRLQNCTEEDYLLSDTLAGREPVPASIFRALNVLISRVTGTSESEHSTHYHHLRHAFASWLLLRLLLPEGAKPPEYLQKEDSDWLIAGTNSLPRELRRRTQPWGGDVFLASQLLGHLHSSTTMGRYFHFAGELLRIYLQRCPWLRPVPAMFAAAMGRKPGTQELNASSAMRFAIALLGKRVQSDPRRLIQTGRLDEPQESPFYRKLKETRLFLRYVQTPDGPIEDAANFFGWDRNRARSVVRVAEHLSTMRTGNGFLRHRFRMIESQAGVLFQSIEPSWPTDPASREIFRQYTPQIEKLASRTETRQALMQGVEAYANAVWRSDSCPVFHNPTTDGDHATVYLRMLGTLGVNRKDIRFGSFDRKGSDSRRRWREVLDLGRAKFERRKPPYGGFESTQPWLSIEPTFGSESNTSGGLFGLRCLLILSLIALSD